MFMFYVLQWFSFVAAGKSPPPPKRLNASRSEISLELNGKPNYLSLSLGLKYSIFILNIPGCVVQKRIHFIPGIILAYNLSMFF